MKQLAKIIVYVLLSPAAVLILAILPLVIGSLIRYKTTWLDDFSDDALRVAGSFAEFIWLAIIGVTAIVLVKP